MGNYQHILLAVELTSHDEEVVSKALRIAKSEGAKLSLVHSVEFMPTLTYEAPAIAEGAQLLNLEERIFDDEERKLINVADGFKINRENVYLKHGPSKQAIINLAKELEVDLIVLGSHRKHGFYDTETGRLLPKIGSTVNAVLKLAPCDVMVIKH